MMNGVKKRHRLLAALKIADADIMDIGITSIEFSEPRVVRAVERTYDSSREKAGSGKPLRRLQMDDVAGARRILHCPSRVIKLFEPGVLTNFDRPLRPLVL